MNNINISEKIVALRKSKGLTQEELASRASINLRTLQRIESGENKPRGHTLQVLARELNFPIEEFAVSPLKEDKSFLQLLNLSALAFWVIPLGNLIVPLILWLMKRDTVKGVYEFGVRVINFQITWSLLIYGLSGVMIFAAMTHPSWFSPLLFMYAIAAILFLCLINSIFIIIASFQIKQNVDKIYGFRLNILGKVQRTQ